VAEANGVRFQIFQSRTAARAWRGTVSGDQRPLKDLKPDHIGHPADGAIATACFAHFSADSLWEKRSAICGINLLGFHFLIR
jgi:hypothetical protein